VFRVLIVDDEPRTCGLLHQALKKYGYSVESAIDADEALDAMEVTPAHVALIDIRMPNRDGIRLIERMQEQYPDTAIIVTGVTSLDPHITSTRGVAGYIEKPFRPEQVCELVARALDQSHLLPPSPPPLRLASPDENPPAIAQKSLPLPRELQLSEPVHRDGVLISLTGLPVGKTTIASELARQIGAVLRLTRAAWRSVIDRTGVRLVDVEIVGSDTDDDHRPRDGSRPDDQPWDRERIVIDTTGCSIEESVRRLLAVIGEPDHGSPDCAASES
jgi:DNA-binding response OmpR family regulator